MAPSWRAQVTVALVGVVVLVTQRDEACRLPQATTPRLFIILVLELQVAAERPVRQNGLMHLTGLRTGLLGFASEQIRYDGLLNLLEMHAQDG